MGAPSARASWRSRPIVAPAEESSTGVRRIERRTDPPPIVAGPFFEKVVRGLSVTPKSLPVEYMFDAVGARLFACLASVDGHSAVRSELAMFRDHAEPIARLIGERATLVDPSCGDGMRAALLARHLARPVEVIVADRVIGAADRATIAIRARAPLAPVLALGVTDPWRVEPPRGANRTVVQLSASLVGELPPDILEGRLARLRRAAGRNAVVLAGVDLLKPACTLEAAYADRAGVAAAFDMNLLARINRELRGGFQLAAFDHRAVYDEARACVELQLVSKRAQWADVGGQWFSFAAGEPIVTMTAYKYTLQRFAALSYAAGWRLERVFLDGERSTALVLLAG